MWREYEDSVTGRFPVLSNPDNHTQMEFKPLEGSQGISHVYRCCLSANWEVSISPDVIRDYR